MPPPAPMAGRYWRRRLDHGHRRSHPGGRPGLADGQVRTRGDNLQAAELVTASGEVRQVDGAAHPDLFWALRGGGGNFGVVTAFTYRLHPLQTVTGGLIAHPLAAAPELLRFYREAIADASDELSVFAGLLHAPDGSGAKLAALVVFHAGDPDQAERELAPFRSFGSPLMAQVGRMPYPQMNTLLDGGYPDGALTTGSPASRPASPISSSKRPSNDSRMHLRR
jgi:FAD/FMN-containing dehydrogenase